MNVNSLMQYQILKAATKPRSRAIGKAAFYDRLEVGLAAPAARRS
jgi:hypothetical protein